MSTLLNPVFWFNLRPGSLNALPRDIFIGFILILIISTVLFFIAKKKKSLFRGVFASLYNFSISNTLLGLLLLFFNYEIIPFFSAYFWYLIWFAIMIGWLIAIGLKIKKVFTNKRGQGEIDELKKYLP